MVLRVRFRMIQNDWEQEWSVLVVYLSLDHMSEVVRYLLIPIAFWAVFWKASLFTASKAEAFFKHSTCTSSVSFPSFTFQFQSGRGPSVF